MNDDYNIYNISELKSLKSLNLETSNSQQDKEDAFEIEFNNLLSKITNQINIIKNNSVNSFQFKPLNIDFDMENSSNDLSLTNDSINNNYNKYNNKNNIDNKEYIIDNYNNSRDNNNYIKNNHNNSRDNNKSSKDIYNIKNEHIIQNKQINLHFIWNTKDDKEYIIKIGQKETLKDAVDKLFMDNYDELQNYNIECVYLLLNRNKMTLTINKNKQTNKNNNDKKILSIQNCETLDNLNIYNNTYIYFETKEIQTDEAIRAEEEEKYKQYLKQGNNGNKQLLNFKTTNNNFYCLFADKNITFSELFNNLKNRYRSLKDVEIKYGIYNSNAIEKNKFIYQYNININSHILLYIN